MDMPKFRDGRIHFRNAGMKGLKTKYILRSIASDYLYDVYCNINAVKNKILVCKKILDQQAKR